MELSVSIINALSRAGLFLPDDFFKDTAPAASKNAPTSSQTRPLNKKADPKLAAEARRARMMEEAGVHNSSDDNDVGRPSFKPKRKISREEAQAEKEAIRASLRNTDEVAEKITHNSTPPDIYKDLKNQGFDGEVFEREIDLD